MDNEHMLGAEAFIRDVTGRNVNFIPSPNIISRSTALVRYKAPQVVAKVEDNFPGGWGGFWGAAAVTVIVGLLLAR